MASFIDLTMSSDDEASRARPVRKRYKRGSTLAEDITIVEAPPAAAAPRNAAAVDNEDGPEFVVVGATGNVSVRQGRARDTADHNLRMLSLSCILQLLQPALRFVICWLMHVLGAGVHHLLLWALPPQVWNSDLPHTRDL